MKLLTFEHAGRASWGALAGDEVADLGAATGHAGIVEALREDALGEAASAVDAAARIPLSEIGYLPVLAPPAKLVCIGLNYMVHVREMNRTVPTVPSVFLKYHNALVGHERDIVRPRVSDAFDFEGELAVVIGRAGRYIEEEDALGYVAGYTILNDGSIRDWQEENLAAGKNFPDTSGFGPCFVTADEIPDPHALAVRTRLNGETVQDGNTADFIFGIPRLVSYVSGFTPLAPGDAISTGTPHGVGHGRTPPLYMKPGDTIEVEIERVGRLANRVVQES
ncbi:MAG: fumarylacetoacetate hydrolase family protein [Defluviicoccus sp.]|nr:fumarylacetoacetate hydrolase family protein [Defluviicoccus sp.]MDE0382610.1 fumarylacetoacetate hydrolase family protein [Defluviicoccus sp.]